MPQENSMHPIPQTLPVFAPDEFSLATDLLAAKVATMLGRKLEEDDWDFVYCNAKSIPRTDWSNLSIDVNHQGLGVEHKTLRVNKSGPIKNECGTTKMHPAGTRSIRIPQGEENPNIVLEEVFKQYQELIELRTESVRVESPNQTVDMRMGWLLWKTELDEFLYFEEPMTSPVTENFYAEWAITPPRGARKGSKSLWVYEKATGKKRYSVTTAAGAKIQPYFDVPPPNDPNLYYFKVQGISLEDNLVKVWLTRTTAKYLETLLGSISTEALSDAILDFDLTKTRPAKSSVSPYDIALPILIQRAAYEKLKNVFENKPDEYIFRQFVSALEEQL